MVSRAVSGVASRQWCREPSVVSRVVEGNVVFRGGERRNPSEASVVAEGKVVFGGANVRTTIGGRILKLSPKTANDVHSVARNDSKTFDVRRVHCPVCERRIELEPHSDVIDLGVSDDCGRIVTIGYIRPVDSRFEAQLVPMVDGRSILSTIVQSAVVDLFREYGVAAAPVPARCISNDRQRGVLCGDDWLFGTSR